MGRAAEGEAAGRQPALRGEWATDPVTLRRVAAALLSQLGGELPTAPAEEPLASAGYLDRCTHTSLSQVRGDAR
jgi:hypothetical protein